MTLVALAMPAALPLASRLAAVSATTSVAPEASPKPASAGQRCRLGGGDGVGGAGQRYAGGLGDARGIAGGQQVGGAVRHRQRRTEARANPAQRDQRGRLCGGDALAVPVSDTPVALARPVALASRLAALSVTSQRRAGGQGEAVQRGQRRRLRGGDGVGCAGQRHTGRLGDPGGIGAAGWRRCRTPAASRRRPAAKPCSAASVAACAAVTVLIPLSVTLVALASPAALPGQQVATSVGHHQRGAGCQR